MPGAMTEEVYFLALDRNHCLTEGTWSTPNLLATSQAKSMEDFLKQLKL